MALLKRYTAIIFLLIFIIGLGAKVFAAQNQYFDWALVYISNGMILRGIDNLKKASAREPANLEISTMLGMAYAAQHKNSEAIAEFKKGLQLTTDNSFLWALSGTVHLETGELKQAKSAFENAIKSDPDCVTALSGLGEIARRSGQLAEAEKHLLRAVKIVPTRAAGYLELAKLYDAMGKDDKEVDILKEGITKAPGDPELAYRLGTLLEKLGYRDEALIYYKMALKWNPDFSQAKQAIERLSGLGMPA